MKNGNPRRGRPIRRQISGSQPDTRTLLVPGICRGCPEFSGYRSFRAAVRGLGRALFLRPRSGSTAIYTPFLFRSPETLNISGDRVWVRRAATIKARPRQRLDTLRNARCGPHPNAPDQHTRRISGPAIRRTRSYSSVMRLHLFPRKNGTLLDAVQSGNARPRHPRTSSQRLRRRPRRRFRAYPTRPVEGAISASPRHR